MRHSLWMLAAVGLAMAAPAQARPWRHGILEAKSDSGFIMMATQQGFAQKYGLELQLVPLKNETLGLRALIAGDLDSYEGPPPFAAVARGAEVKEIGCPWAGLPHAIFARNGIAGIKDLAGKTMATSAPGSLPDLVGRAALEQAGLAPGSVHLATVGSDADRYRSLIAGVVDAAVISGEYTPIVDATKVHVLAKAIDIAPDFLRICYQSSASVLAARPDDAAKFLATEMDALRYALGHKDAEVKLTQQETGQKPTDPRAAFMFDEVSQTHPIDPTLPVSPVRIAAMQTILVHMGVIQKPVDVAAMIDAGPRAKALALVGK